MMKEFSVFQVNQYIKNLINNDFILSNILVRGEISGPKESRGNIYFNLKDERASISCIIFSNVDVDRSFLKEGNKVLIQGKVALYEKTGEYSLYVKTLENVGLGKFYEDLQKLKQKLDDNGMFDEDHKKEIPRFSMKIGVVTSKTGAAIEDIKRTIFNKNPYAKIYLYPAKVQGENAARTIEKGVDILDTLGLDVIIIGRGGGSVEDLYCFNDEMLCYSIYKANTPIISAVGHEVDNTIADLVADKRVATPTAAAELATFNYYEFIEELKYYKESLYDSVENNIERLKEHLENQKRYLEIFSPSARLNRYKENIRDKKKTLDILIIKKVEALENKIKNQELQLELFNPIGKLEKGMAFITDADGKIIKSSKKIKENDILGIEMKEEKLKVKVLKKEVRKL